MTSNITTLEKVFNRVDALPTNCYDQFVDVPDIEFVNLETVKIGNANYGIKPIAQRFFAYLLRIP